MEDPEGVSDLGFLEEKRHYSLMAGSSLTGQLNWPWFYWTQRGNTEWEELFGICSQRRF
jgi:hypothetical protein